MRIVVLIVALCLAGCTPAPTPVNPAYIPREQAIEAAAKLASQSAPEVGGAKDPPVNAKADQVSLAEALKRMYGEGAYVPQGYQPDMPVWYVTMDGEWPNEVDAPGITVATQVPYRHYVTILDALTGRQIEFLLRP